MLKMPREGGHSRFFSPIVPLTQCFPTLAASRYVDFNSQNSTASMAIDKILHLSLAKRRLIRILAVEVHMPRNGQGWETLLFHCYTQLCFLNNCSYLPSLVLINII